MWYDTQKKGLCFSENKKEMHTSQKIYKTTWNAKLPWDPTACQIIGESVKCTYPIQNEKDQEFSYYRYIRCKLKYYSTASI